MLEVLYALDEVRRYADRTFAPAERPERSRNRPTDPETPQRIGAPASAQKTDRTLWRWLAALYQRFPARQSVRRPACLDR